ncbi:unnamed protein product [Vitrella brassicaformis CCMP3155]|uniref:Uncharacterized protein n=5 Tax=Vitrella brassicaformis TaxID=1169539 RepID=A0A0G4ERJ2_VITBC|nr:unnamed protein product [Vitrella brassicaformis CCMP3155]|eukprot:CEM00027.1 unnamed protein product [Vitrella brassicaformis CCMP3155]
MSSSWTRSPPICPQLWFEILDYLDPCDYRRLEACCSLFRNLPEGGTNWRHYCQRSKIIDEDGEAARRREFDSWACPFTLGIPVERLINWRKLFRLHWSTTRQPIADRPCPSSAPPHTDDTSPRSSRDGKVLRISTSPRSMMRPHPGRASKQYVSRHVVPTVAMRLERVRHRSVTVRIQGMDIRLPAVPVSVPSSSSPSSTSCCPASSGGRLTGALLLDALRVVCDGIPKFMPLRLRKVQAGGRPGCAVSPSGVLTADQALMLEWPSQVLIQMPSPHGEAAEHFSPAVDGDTPMVDASDSHDFSPPFWLPSADIGQLLSSCDCPQDAIRVVDQRWRLPGREDGQRASLGDLGLRGHEQWSLVERHGAARDGEEAIYFEAHVLEGATIAGFDDTFIVLIRCDDHSMEETYLELDRDACLGDLLDALSRHLERVMGLAVMETVSGFLWANPTRPHQPLLDQPKPTLKLREDLRWCSSERVTIHLATPPSPDTLTAANSRCFQWALAMRSGLYRTRGPRQPSTSGTQRVMLLVREVEPTPHGADEGSDASSCCEQSLPLPSGDVVSDDGEGGDDDERGETHSWVTAGTEEGWPSSPLLGAGPSPPSPRCRQPAGDSAADEKPCEVCVGAGAGAGEDQEDDGIIGMSDDDSEMDFRCDSPAAHPHHYECEQRHRYSFAHSTCTTTTAAAAAAAKTRCRSYSESYAFHLPPVSEPATRPPMAPNGRRAKEGAMVEGWSSPNWRVVPHEDLRVVRTSRDARQFEFHPVREDVMLVGHKSGAVSVIDFERDVSVGREPVAQCPILGLAWLHLHPTIAICGAANDGTTCMLQWDENEGLGRGLRRLHSCRRFEQLSSLSVNVSDDYFMTSGFRRDLALYDVATARQLQVFDNVHHHHINILRFSNHSPHIFATSSFDQTCKLWDLREKICSSRPAQCFHTGCLNVMCCFSPDDRFLLCSGIDASLHQFSLGSACEYPSHDGLQVPPLHSQQNYRRSLYLSTSRHFITAATDESFVRVMGIHGEDYGIIRFNGLLKTPLPSDTDPSSSRMGYDSTALSRRLAGRNASVSFDGQGSLMLLSNPLWGSRMPGFSQAIRFLVSSVRRRMPFAGPPPPGMSIAEPPTPPPPPSPSVIDESEDTDTQQQQQQHDPAMAQQPPNQQQAAGATSRPPTPYPEMRSRSEYVQSLRGHPTKALQMGALIATYSERQASFIALATIKGGFDQERGEDDEHEGIGHCRYGGG